MKEDVETANEHCDFRQIIFPIWVCYLRKIGSHGL